MGKESKQKKITREYFNIRAEDWSENVYNPTNRYLRFPSSLVRDEIVVSEIKNGGRKKLKIIDLGCGTGELAIALLKEGHTLVGIDNAPKMIQGAVQNLNKAEIKKTKNEADLFKVCDLEDAELLGTFDAVTATGVIEYLDSDEKFLKTVSNLLNDKGHAYISFRNQLYNTVSGNRFLQAEIKNGSIDRLIHEFNDVGRFSPISAAESIKLQEQAYKRAAQALKNIKSLEVDANEIKKKKAFPKDMKRRFHSPHQLEKLGKSEGLRLSHVVYFHFHPFHSQFQDDFQVAYNQVALALQPLGRTPLGASLCSGFVAVFEKRKTKRK